MAEIDITKMSSKGQIVIPIEMRKGFSKGEKLVIIRSGDKLLLKKANDFEKNIRDDLAFAKKTEEAIKRYEHGHFKSMNETEFLSELEKW